MAQNNRAEASVRKPGPIGYAGGTCDRRGLPNPKVANPLSAACARWSICVIVRGKDLFASAAISTALYRHRRVQER